MDQVLVFDAGWNPSGSIAVGRKSTPMAIGPDGRLVVVVTIESFAERAGASRVD